MCNYEGINHIAKYNIRSSFGKFLYFQGSAGFLLSVVFDKENSHFSDRPVLPGMISTSFFMYGVWSYSYQTSKRCRSLGLPGVQYGISTITAGHVYLYSKVR